MSVESLRQENLILEERRTILADKIDVRDYEGHERRAFSCLVEPQPGDTVLVANIGGEPMVLAVLVRPGLGDAILALPDPAAALTVRAQAVSIEAATLIEMAAPDIGLRARGLRLTADAFSVIAKLALLAGDKLRSLARDQMTSAERISVQATQRVTNIDEVDIERARIRVKEADLSSARAQTAVVQARDDLRFDGKRVLIG